VSSRLRIVTHAPLRRAAKFDGKGTNCGLVTHFKFETGSEKLKSLEEKVFVGSGRFIVEEGKPTVVEYKISEVVAA